MKTYNRTNFPDIEAKIERLLHPIKRGKSLWRERTIVLYEHPRNPNRVISDGTTFDGSMRVIADESKEDWTRELSAAGEFCTR